MSNMKAKHYQLIALALADNMPFERDEQIERDQWVNDCHAVANALERENPTKFDREKFLRLCGVLE